MLGYGGSSEEACVVGGGGGRDDKRRRLGRRRSWVGAEEAGAAVLDRLMLAVEDGGGEGC
jgi:hypothetical protein